MTERQEGLSKMIEESVEKKDWVRASALALQYGKEVQKEKEEKKRNPYR